MAVVEFQSMVGPISSSIQAAVQFHESFARQPLSHKKTVLLAGGGEASYWLPSFPAASYFASSKVYLAENVEGPDCSRSVSDAMEEEDGMAVLAE